jgi:hypothetical protein
MRARVAGGPVWLVVITTRSAVEAWATHVLADVIPRAGGWSVVGPSSTRRITTQAAARRDPSAALLSAMIHAGSRDEDLVPAIAGGDNLYEIIRQRYERGSTIITSNRAIEEWPPLFGDLLLASAALDRLLHHAHVIEMDGDTFRNPPPAKLPVERRRASRVMASLAASCRGSQHVDHREVDGLDHAVSLAALCANTTPAS